MITNYCLSAVCLEGHILDAVSSSNSTIDEAMCEWECAAIEEGLPDRRGVVIPGPGIESAVRRIF